MEKVKLDCEFRRVPSMDPDELAEIANCYESLRTKLLKELIDVDDRLKTIYRISSDEKKKAAAK